MLRTTLLTFLLDMGCRLASHSWRFISRFSLGSLTQDNVKHVT
jgi:hypothetical protein